METKYKPRERLQQLGVSSLSDAELLAVILQKGVVGENVIDMSHRLLSKYGSRLSSCSLQELQEIKGVGVSKACQILAVFEFSRRCQVGTNLSVITCAEDVFNLMFPKIGHLDKEHFVVLLLDSKNRVIKEETVAVGTLNSALIHPREVFKSAIRESANAIILVHNHPSGDCTPSSEDLEVTESLVKAGEVLNINVLDHVVIGSSGWWSYKD